MCVYLGIHINIHSTQTYIIYIKQTFILDVINHTHLTALEHTVVVLFFPSMKIISKASKSSKHSVIQLHYGFSITHSMLTNERNLERNLLRNTEMSILCYLSLFFPVIYILYSSRR